MARDGSSRAKSVYVRGYSSDDFSIIINTLCRITFLPQSPDSDLQSPNSILDGLAALASFLLFLFHLFTPSKLGILDMISRS